jgi:hypothetical protein
LGRIVEFRERCERDCLFLSQLSSVEYPSRQIDAFAVKQTLLPAGIALAEDPAGTSVTSRIRCELSRRICFKEFTRRGRDTLFFPEEAEAMPAARERPVTKITTKFNRV